MKESVELSRIINSSEYKIIVFQMQEETDDIPGEIPIEIAAPIAMIFLIILILGVFGNVITCVVIFKNPSLRNATNYYLFSLAVSDLILLTNGTFFNLLSLWNYGRWTWGLILCKLLNFLYGTTYCVSTLTILAFSVERYLAICHPLYFRSINGLKRPIGFIITLWILGSIFSSVEFFRQLVKYVFVYPCGYVLDPKETIYCTFELSESILILHSCIIVILVFFIPMVVNFILYAKMQTKLQNSCQILNSKSGDNGNSVRIQSRRKTVKMLRAVVMATFICWSPNAFWIFLRLIAYPKSMDLGDNFRFWLIYFPDMSIYTSTVLNPVIYNLMSTQFQEAFKNFLRGNRELSSEQNAEQNAIQ